MSVSPISQSCLTIFVMVRAAVNISSIVILHLYLCLFLLDSWMVLSQYGLSHEKTTLMNPNQYSDSYIVPFSRPSHLIQLNLTFTLHTAFLTYTVATEIAENYC